MEVTAHRRVMMGKIEGLRVEGGNAAGGGGGGGGGGAVVPAPRTAGGSLVGVSVAHRLSAARTEIAALRGRLALAGGPVR
eukprot:COSAG01_NODE_537_length_15764_cov_54.273795_15_plen_80_part_00